MCACCRCTEIMSNKAPGRLSLDNTNFCNWIFHGLTAFSVGVLTGPGCGKRMSDDIEETVNRYGEAAFDAIPKEPVFISTLYVAKKIETKVSVFKDMLEIVATQKDPNSFFWAVFELCSLGDMSLQLLPYKQGSSTKDPTQLDRILTSNNGRFSKYGLGNVAIKKILGIAKDIVLVSE